MSTMIHYIDDDKTHTTKSCKLHEHFKAPFSTSFQIIQPQLTWLNIIFTATEFLWPLMKCNSTIISMQTVLQGAMSHWKWFNWLLRIKKWMENHFQSQEEKPGWMGNATNFQKEFDWSLANAVNFGEITWFMAMLTAPPTWLYSGKSPASSANRACVSYTWIYTNKTK